MQFQILLLNLELGLQIHGLHSIIPHLWPGKLQQMVRITEFTTTDFYMVSDFFFFLNPVLYIVILLIRSVVEH